MYVYREIHLHSWISKYVHLLRLKRLFFFLFFSSFLGKDTINKINMSMPVCVRVCVCMCPCMYPHLWVTSGMVCAHTHIHSHTQTGLYIASVLNLL